MYEICTLCDTDICKPGGSARILQQDRQSGRFYQQTISVQQYFLPGGIGVFVSGIPAYFYSVGKAASCICKIASASFGVYLIHEHKNLRYLWPVWAGTERYADTPLFLGHWVLTILVIYGVCMIIDLGRQYLFAWAGGIWTGKEK